MNWATAASTGFGLGLAYYGGLWLSVHELKNGQSRKWFARARVARFALATVTFCALLQVGGLVAVTAGLLGLFAAKCYLVRAIRGASNGR